MHLGFRSLAPAVIGLVLFLAAFATPLRAEAPSRGQTVYVPIYSHIYHGIKTRSFALTVTVSVRNVDPKASFTLTSVDFYDTDGRFLRHLLDKPLVVGPLATKEFIIEERDESGGSGANFLVRWTAEAPLNPPLIEAVMIGTSSNQGVSFLSKGLVIGE